MDARPLWLPYDAKTNIRRWYVVFSDPITGAYMINQQERTEQVLAACILYLVPEIDVINDVPPGELKVG